MKKDKQKWPIPLQFYELVSLYICKVFLYVWSLSKLSFQQIGDLEVVKIIGDKVGGWSETLIFHPPEAECAKGGVTLEFIVPLVFIPLDVDGFLTLANLSQARNRGAPGFKSFLVPLNIE